MAEIQGELMQRMCWGYLTCLQSCVLLKVFEESWVVWWYADQRLVGLY